MTLRISHRTLYDYAIPARRSQNEVRLMPLDDAFQRVRAFDLDVTPQVRVFRYDDIGGVVHTFGVHDWHDRLEIRVEAEVDTLLANPFDGLNLLDDDWDGIDNDRVRHDYAEFLAPSRFAPRHPGAEMLARAVRRPNQSVAGYLVDLNHHLARLLKYDKDATHVHSTLAEVLDIKAGVCQDFAHVGIACCRSMGIPARYVSGYLLVERGSGMQGEQGSHAWLEALLPNGRWLAIDPTNSLLANDRYVRVHVGRDYADVTPVKGVYTGPKAKLTVSVNVRRA